MRADVVEGLDRGVFLAHQQELFMTDLEYLVVTGFGQIGRHTGEQPDTRPEQSPLLLHVLLRGVTLRVGHIEAVVHRGLLRLQRMLRCVQVHRPFDLVIH
jgi:hypothetical protein